MTAAPDRTRLAELLAGELATWEQRTGRSRALLTRASASMPSGVPMAWMRGLYRHAPIFVDDARGARFRDVDGHEYLDMNQADMSMCCGYAPEPVTRAVAARIAAGSTFVLPTEDAVVVSELLAERTAMPRWQYTLSASTANVEAIRLARVATGRERVLTFHGNYHGHIDDTLTDGGPDAVPPGLPRAAADGVVSVPFNDLDALDAHLRSGEVACVLTEPALTNIGLVLPRPGFHEGLRRLTREHGTLLVVDEAHTFWMGFGGMTRQWQLEPDLLTLGKGLGGGVPIGAYGMTDALGRVMEDHLDVDVADTPGLATGGTTFANAVSMAGARAALEHVYDPPGYDRVVGLGARLADGLDRMLRTHDLPWRAARLGSRSGFWLSPAPPKDADEAQASMDVELIDLRRLYLANRGVWEAIATAGPNVGFAHDAGDVDQYLDLVDGFLEAIAS